ncbi:MAG: hypothetical protein AB1608_08090 [Thermoproteota archaeon]
MPKKRGKPPILQQLILERLSTGLFSESDLVVSLGSSQPNISKAISKLQQKNLVTHYQQVKTRKSVGKPAYVGFQGKGSGAPKKFFGLTNHGIQTMLTSQDSKMSLERFWNFLFNYYPIKNSLQVKFSNLIETYLQDTLGIKKELAVGNNFINNFELSLSTIITTNSESYLDEIELLKKENTYFEILYQLFITPITEKQIICNNYDKIKILDELENNLIIVKFDSKNNTYLLTIFGFLIVIKEIKRLVNDRINFDPRIGVLVRLIKKEDLDEHINDLSILEKYYLVHKINSVYELTIFGIHVMLALQQVEDGNDALGTKNTEKKEIIYEIMKEPYCYPEGGSTWETAMFIDVLLRISIPIYGKYFKLIFPKWIFLKKFITTTSLSKYLIDAYEAQYPSGKSIIFESGFQEILNDLHNLLNFHTGTLEKFRVIGDKVYEEHLERYIIKRRPDLEKVYKRIDNPHIFDEHSLDIISKNREELEPDFEREYEEIITHLKVSEMLLDDSWIKNEKLRKTLLHPVTNAVSDILTYKFYTIIFSLTREGKVSEKWIGDFKNESDLVNFYKSLYEKISFYNNMASVKKQEFYDQILT